MPWVRKLIPTPIPILKTWSYYNDLCCNANVLFLIAISCLIKKESAAKQGESLKLHFHRAVQFRSAQQVCTTTTTTTTARTKECVDWMVSAVWETGHQVQQTAETEVKQCTNYIIITQKQQYCSSKQTQNQIQQQVLQANLLLLT